MSTPTATSRDRTPIDGYVVLGPRKSDSIGGALRTAFGHQQDKVDDFDALLLRIDLADRAIGNC